jgi:hypothetical protein
VDAQTAAVTCPARPTQILNVSKVRSADPPVTCRRLTSTAAAPFGRSALLTALRCALPAPFPRLPAVHALLAAEAALALCHPAAPMFPALMKALLHRPALDLASVPLFGRLILAGSADAGAERAWLLRLLRCGLRGPADARLYRRQYCLEMAMALADAGGGGDPAAARLALQLLCTAATVPRAARHLSEHSGLAGWLAGAAAAAAAAALRGGGGGGAEEEALGDAVGALRALRQLTALRAVTRARRGAVGAAEDFALAARQLAAGLRAAAPPGVERGAVQRLWAEAMPFLEAAGSAAASAASAGEGQAAGGGDPLLAVFTAGEAAAIRAAASGAARRVA